MIYLPRCRFRLGTSGGRNPPKPRYLFGRKLVKGPIVQETVPRKEIMARRSKALIEFLGKQPGPAMRALAFQCPDCGGCELNLIQTAVRVIFDVTCVYKDPLSELGEDVYEEIDQVFFECPHCGYDLGSDFD